MSVSGAVRSRPARIAGAWASTILLLVTWQLTTRGAPDARALPSPSEVMRSWGDLQSEGLLWPSVGASAMRVGLGLGLGVALAVPAGIFAGISTLGLAVIDKPVHMLRSIPFNALTPLLIILIGIGETMKVALIAIGVFGLVYVNIRDGVRSLDPGLLELAKAYRVPCPTVVCKIIVLGTLPAFMTGLRLALAVAWIALVTCETVNSTTGVGYILARAQQFSRTDQMVLCVALYAALGLASEGLIHLLEEAITPWRRIRQS